MDDVAAVPAEPVAEPAAPEPAKPEPVNPRNFSERMRQLGYEKREAEAKAETESAGEPRPAAPEPKPKVVDVNPKLEQLKALASELGYSLEGERVALEEYTKFREHKRKHYEAFQKQTQAEREKLEAEKKELHGEVEWARQVKAAREAGDLDKLAQLHGWKDYNDQQQEAINRFADPNYKRLRELERDREERLAAEKKANEERQTQEQTAAQQRAIQQHCEGLSKQMAESKDPLIATFADNPEFVWAIFQIQRENYDGETTVTPEQAIKIAARGASRTVRENMKAQYDRLRKAAESGAFGELEPKPKVIPPKTKAPATPRAEAAGRGKWNSDTDFRKHALERLAQAAEEDRKNGLL